MFEMLKMDEKITLTNLNFLDHLPRIDQTLMKDDNTNKYGAGLQTFISELSRKVQIDTTKRVVK